MNKTERPSWRPRISLRTVLEALFVLGVFFAVARGQYRPTIKPGDLLEIRVVGTLRHEPIDGFFRVDEDGKVQLGPSYGLASVGGLSIADATVAIEHYLRKILREPEVSVERLTFDLAFQKLQTENRRLQREVASLTPPPPRAPTFISPSLIRALESHDGDFDLPLPSPSAAGQGKSGN